MNDRQLGSQTDGQMDGDRKMERGQQTRGEYKICGHHDVADN